VRDATLAHSGQLPELLSSGCALAILRHPSGLGLVTGYRADVLVDEATLTATLARDVRRGLGTDPKQLPPKYFYDTAGSALFEQITRLPEYYLTRAEHALLDAHAAAILADTRPREIVELGAGSPAKLRRLLAALDGAGPLARYVPVDVDGALLGAAGRTLLETADVREVHAVVGDFERHLPRVPLAVGRRLVAFLGSTLGNLDPAARHGLLRQVRRLLAADDRFLLGVDLVKSPCALHAAYDDTAGVTAEFNRNVLRVINRRLDGEFDADAFGHYARWDAEASRVEMHLVAPTDHAVRVRALGLTVGFEAGETIWTESSYKFTRTSVEAMLRAAGLALVRWETDGAFALALAAPARAPVALRRAA
jgi:L-histidine N-alpha-methyltransferase